MASNLAYFISNSLIVLLERAQMFKDFIRHYIVQTAKDPSVFKQPRRRIISIAFLSRFVCYRLFLVSTPSHHYFRHCAHLAPSFQCMIWTSI
jgi:hypothetical protein